MKILKRFHKRYSDHFYSRLMFTLLIVLSLNIAKTAKKYEHKRKNIKIHNVAVQTCDQGSPANTESCLTAYADVTNKLSGDASTLLTSLEGFVTQCLGTICGTPGCQGIFNVEITDSNVAEKLSNFASLCAVSQSPPDDGQGPNPPNDISSDEENVVNETSANAPGGQNTGKGYQRWNMKGVGLLMILLNLISSLYLMS
jgi:hypothetical protein